MKAKITNLFFTFNALSLMIVVFIAKTVYSNTELNKSCFLLILPILSFLLSIFLVKFSFKLLQNRSKDEITTEPSHIESANNVFLPTYLGYFFVALSIESVVLFVFIFIILFVFTYKSSNFYFNPIFLLFGFNFYHIVISDNSIQKFIITKKNILMLSNAQFGCLKRINNFTFIDMETENE